MSRSIAETLAGLEHAYRAIAARRPWTDHPVLASAPLDDHIRDIRAGSDAPLAALVALAHDGDSDALTVIVHALAPMLRRLIRGPNALLGEILEDHLSSACHAVLATDPGDDRLAARLLQRTNSRARNFRRRHVISHDTPSTAVDRIATADPAETICDREVARVALHRLQAVARTETASGALHPLGWQLLVASRVEGLEGDALADRYGLSRAATRAAISRTSRKLRTLIVA
jgi:DNA-directed RNA polymerase specialized sigma24 family protein